MIEPLQAGDGLLADIAATAPSPDRLDLWWLGQSGFLVAHAGRHLVLDPYLSDSLTRKYAQTDTPHVRMTRRVIEPERLGFADVVAASHAHTDHLDPDTLRPLLAAGAAPLVAPEAHRVLALERAGIGPGRLTALDDGATTAVAGFAIAAVPAAHEAIERDADGHMLHLGYVVRCGPFALYHAGDTLPYAGQAERVGAVDVALLPINGRAPERRVAGNLDGEQAAALAHALPARVAVPCHFEMFAFNTASPDGFVAACERSGQPCAVLRAGERLTLRSARAAA